MPYFCAHCSFPLTEDLIHVNSKGTAFISSLQPDLYYVRHNYYVMLRGWNSSLY